MQQHPFGYEHYEPPGATGSRPAVITWYRIYSAMVVVLYVGFVVLWQLMTPGANLHSAQAQNEMIVMTIIMAVVVIGFGGFYALAALVPYKPWGWTVGLVAIALGLTSCLAVVSIPLLIYWLKPETKAAFCRL